VKLLRLIIPIGDLKEFQTGLVGKSVLARYLCNVELAGVLMYDCKTFIVHVCGVNGESKISFTNYVKIIFGQLKTVWPEGKSFDVSYNMKYILNTQHAEKDSITLQVAFAGQKLKIAFVRCPKIYTLEQAAEWYPFRHQSMWYDFNSNEIVMNEKDRFNINQGYVVVNDILFKASIPTF
jgi:hypothetical protein